jgi:mono/diheme cytochrome c family protein
MKAMVMGLAMVLGVSALASAQGDAAKGEKLYGEQKCALCHSIGDKGNKKGPLDGVAAKYSAAELRDWLVKPAEMEAKIKSTRKPSMKAYDKLSKDDLDALVAYMQTLKK